MNKQTTNIIMGLLLVLLMGVLVGCPTEAPKEKKKSGDEEDIILNATIENVYIDFHSYYGKVINNTGKSVDGVVFVVSTEETPRPIGDIDPTARLVRNFGVGETRSIAITWDDTFKRADLFVGGVIKEDRTTIRKDTAVVISNNQDYIDNKVNWILKENTQYYVHTYYNNTNANITKIFRTKTYPTNTTDADDMFAGGNTGNIFNANALPNMKFRDPNPVGATNATYNRDSTNYYKFDSVSWGGSLVSGRSNSGVGLLIKFANNPVSFGVAETGKFNIFDTMLIVDKTRTTAKTYDLTKTYGGVTTPKQNLKRATR